jgi:acetyl-CoA C-acetyltransferase
VYAFSAARYIHLGWATEEQLAFVSVKNHDKGALNPNAQYRVRVTVDDVLTSRLIADPLTLLQCAAIGDGAAALVVGRNRKRNRDVPVRGLGLGSGGAWGRGSDVWGFELIRRTAHLAYEDAGLRPSDVSFVELHDAFTIGELVTLGALQLAEPSEVGHLTDSGVTSRGGALPVNPSGGLLSRGHPLGATGVAQVVEVVAQLRGEADARQVDSPAVGLVETMGGGAAGLDGHACVVALLGASASV